MGLYVLGVGCSRFHQVRFHTGYQIGVPCQKALELDQSLGTHPAFYTPLPPKGRSTCVPIDWFRVYIRTKNFEAHLGLGRPEATRGLGSEQAAFSAHIFVLRTSFGEGACFKMVESVRTFAAFPIPRNLSVYSESWYLASLYARIGFPKF